MPHLGVECLDHHLHLVLVFHEEEARPEHGIHRIDHPVEAASGSAFLCEPNDAELVTPTVLDDRHDLDGKGDRAHVKV